MILEPSKLTILRALAAALTATVFAGCLASVPSVSSRGNSVRTGRGDPGPDYMELGSITATHGSGCGGFGAKGSYDGAYALMRNRASERGANYVRIDFESAPHSTPSCFDNEYVLRGVAYRRVGADSRGNIKRARAEERATSHRGTDGTERGQCYGNGTCNKGLVCLSDLCVRMPSEDGAGVDAEPEVAAPAPAAPAVELAPSPNPKPSELRSVILGSLDAAANAEPTLIRWKGRLAMIQMADGTTRAGVIGNVRALILYLADGTPIDLLNIVRITLDD